MEGERSEGTLHLGSSKPLHVQGDERREGTKKE